MLMFKTLDGVSSCVWEQMDTGRYVYVKQQFTHFENKQTNKQTKQKTKTKKCRIGLSLKN